MLYAVGPGEAPGLETAIPCTLPACARVAEPKPCEGADLSFELICPPNMERAPVWIAIADAATKEGARETETAVCGQNERRVNLGSYDGTTNRFLGADLLEL